MSSLATLFIVLWCSMSSASVYFHIEQNREFRTNRFVLVSVDRVTKMRDKSGKKDYESYDTHGYPAPYIIYLQQPEPDSETATGLMDRSRNHVIFSPTSSSRTDAVKFAFYADKEPFSAFWYSESGKFEGEPKPIETDWTLWEVQKILEDMIMGSDVAVKAHPGHFTLIYQSYDKMRDVGAPLQSIVIPETSIPIYGDTIHSEDGAHLFVIYVAALRDFDSEGTEIYHYDVAIVADSATISEYFRFLLPQEEGGAFLQYNVVKRKTPDDPHAFVYVEPETYEECREESATCVASAADEVIEIKPIPPKAKAYRPHIDKSAIEKEVAIYEGMSRDVEAAIETEMKRLVREERKKRGVIKIPEIEPETETRMESRIKAPPKMKIATKQFKRKIGIGTALLHLRKWHDESDITIWNSKEVTFWEKPDGVTEKRWWNPAHTGTQISSVHVSKKEDGSEHIGSRLVSIPSKENIADKKSVMGRIRTAADRFMAAQQYADMLIQYRYDREVEAIHRRKARQRLSMEKSRILHKAEEIFGKYEDA